MGYTRRANILLAILIFNLGISYCIAQPGAHAHKRIITDAEPQIFVDSMLINKSYFDVIAPADILSISVVKEGFVYPEGAVYITLKDHGKLLNLLKERLLSLADIARLYLPKYNNNSQVVFEVNDKLISDTAGVRIPDGHVYNVLQVKARQTNTAISLKKAVVLKFDTKPEPVSISGIDIVKPKF